MHLTYLGNLLLCVWSTRPFREVYARGLEGVQWGLCVRETGLEREGGRGRRWGRGEEGERRDRGGRIVNRQLR